MQNIQFRLPSPRAIIVVVVIIVLMSVIRYIFFPPLTRQFWAPYYSELTPNPVTLLNGWDVLVVDNDAHPDVKNITNGHRGTTKLAYISIGEIADYRADFNDFKAAGIFIGSKKGAPHVYVTDVRNPAFYPIIQKEIIKAQAQGFDGIMLDTLDTTIALGRSDEIGYALDGVTQPYPGMQDIAIALIKRIRIDFPHMKIMVNRAFDIIPSLADTINMVIAEGTIVDTLPDGTYRFHTDDTKAIYDGIWDMLKQTGLPIYTVDYWDMKDTEGVRKVYAAQRAKGGCPYVADITLQILYKEP